MKKYLLFSLLVLSVNLQASKVVSSDKGFFDKILIKKEVSEKIQGRFDGQNDIAVVSDESVDEIRSKEDAVNGLKKQISSYAKSVLVGYLKKANLVGEGFNEYKMAEFGDELATRMIQENRYDIEGVWEDRNTGKCYTLLKVNKKNIDEKCRKIFKNRLEKVIQVLNDLKEGL